MSDTLFYTIAFILAVGMLAIAIFYNPKPKSSQKK